MNAKKCCEDPKCRKRKRGDGINVSVLFCPDDAGFGFKLIIQMMQQVAQAKVATLCSLIESVVTESGYTVQMEAMDSQSLPFVLTQPEFMRRMKEMQQTGGGGMMGNMPDMYNLVVNTNHELVSQILNTKTKNKKDRLIKQALDLAKLSQNLLKGEDLTQFIQRSVDLIK